jgi:predicted methyltransferase
MRSIFPAAIAALMAWAGAAVADSPAIPAYVTAAVADTGRSDADRQRDALRKPEQVIAFAGIRPGDQVGELMPGKGYFTAIFCRVVGPSGHVYAMRMATAGQAPAAAPAPPAPPCANVSTETQTPATLALPSGLDVVWTSENYHDLHNPMFGTPDMAVFNRAVFNALKPGGVYMIEDHVAAAGSGARDTNTLHRIDPALVKSEVLAAGFVLEAESPVLHNATDDHTARVFDLAGKTDKFLFKFRKPLTVAH